MGWGTGNIGGGSGGLNFKVVGNPQPANPKENTIWLNTNQKITGWHFQPTQPDDMAEGEVWIVTGDSGTATFNALKKNAITLCPVSAKQYVSGILVDKTAKSYQGGKWVDWWKGQLYEAGNEFESITGGWVDTPKGTYGSFDTPTLISREIKKNNGSITISESQEQYATGSVSCRTAKKVSLRDYKKLKINITNAAGDVHFKCFTTKPPWSQYDGHVAGIEFGKAGVYTIDVSSVNADVYIMVGVMSYSDTGKHSATATFNKIWLE